MTDTDDTERTDDAAFSDDAADHIGNATKSVDDELRENENAPESDDPPPPDADDPAATVDP